MMHHYKKSTKYPDGITVVLCTLNNAKDVYDCLNSLRNSKYDQLIVVDGSSSDSSAKIARQFTNEVIITKPGLSIQRAAGIKATRYKFRAGIEADNRFPPQYCEDILSYFKSSDFIGVQARLRCILRGSYWEKGLAEFYEIHHNEVGKVDAIGGPGIWYSAFFEDHFLHSTSQGSSVDTDSAELIHNLNLKVGLSPVIAYQYEMMDFSVFYDKYFWYGQGDHQFYLSHNSEWTTLRKFKSISHIFRRYVICYPLKSILRRQPQYIFYFWLSAVVRYLGWLTGLNNFNN